MREEGHIFFSGSLRQGTYRPLLLLIASIAIAHYTSAQLRLQPDAKYHSNTS